MNIYFSGIGGGGVGPLAMLAQDAGHAVFGSDTVESPIYGDLSKRGVDVSLDQSGEFIEQVNRSFGIDLLVYTSALSSDHPELKYAQKHKIASTKRHELLNQIIKHKNLKLIAICGTHGKTTTTGMFVWALKQLGVPVSYSVGTRLSFGSSAKYDHQSEFFVYEADEFDRNMLKFKPYLAVITSMGYDHSDTYKTKEDYCEAFRQFVSQSLSAISWRRDGLKSDGLELLDNTSAEITLAGDHNKANATLVLNSLCRLLPSVPKKQIITALNSFPGTERRFEKLQDKLYTDFAHHPDEIASTIQLAKEYSDNVVVVYQPHQNIRQHQLLKDGGYKNSFGDAKKVYWLPTYLSREDKDLPILTPEDLIKSAPDNSFIEPAEMNQELAQKIHSHIKSGELVVGMAAGDLDDWLRNFSVQH